MVKKWKEPITKNLRRGSEPITKNYGKVILVFSFSQYSATSIQMQSSHRGGSLGIISIRPPLPPLLPSRSRQCSWMSCPPFVGVAADGIHGKRELLGSKPLPRGSQGRCAMQCQVTGRSVSPEMNAGGEPLRKSACAEEEEFNLTTRRGITGAS